MRWIALYSRTGSEILQVSKRLKRYPDLILTDSYRSPEILEQLREHSNVYQTESLPDLMSKLRQLVIDIQRYNCSSAIITLHGFLHIIPEDICSLSSGQIYNGHPALITHYPELKGLNPQERTWRGKYPNIGAVIHRVEAGVDEGEVLSESILRHYEYSTKDKLYEDLHDVLITMWEDFLRRYLR